MSKNELVTKEEVAVLSQVEQEAKMFELKQRKAMMYSKSDLVPKAFVNRVDNCMIAINMAERMNADVLMVMQNLYVVHGNPSFSAKFYIACFNSCRDYSAIKYKLNESRTECYAYCTDLRTGERIEGPLVTLAMAEKEGWSTKKGSKWVNMSELMLRYRAAAHMIRTTAPELAMGLNTKDEHDEIERNTIAGQVLPRTTNLNDVMKAITLEPEQETLGEAIESMDAEASGDLFASNQNEPDRR